MIPFIVATSCKRSPNLFLLFTFVPALGMDTWCCLVYCRYGQLETDPSSNKWKALLEPAVLPLTSPDNRNEASKERRYKARAVFKNKVVYLSVVSPYR